MQEHTHLSHSLKCGLCTSGGCKGLKQAKMIVSWNLPWDEHETDMWHHHYQLLNLNKYKDRLAYCLNKLWIDCRAEAWK